MTNHHIEREITVARIHHLSDIKYILLNGIVTIHGFKHLMKEKTHKEIFENNSEGKYGKTFQN